MDKNLDSGYLSTPLAKKLGIKEGQLLHVLFTPKDYLGFFNDLPDKLTLEQTEPFTMDADMIHTFVLDEEELEITFKHAVKYLKKQFYLDKLAKEDFRYFNDSRKI